MLCIPTSAAAAAPKRGQRGSTESSSDREGVIFGCRLPAAQAT
jgi:hypothetical protein